MPAVGLAVTMTEGAALLGLSVQLGRQTCPQTVMTQSEQGWDRETRVGHLA